MTTISSDPTTLTIANSQASAIGAVAAVMLPGTWVRITQSNDQDSVLGIGSASGSTIHYSNSMPWNPVTKCIEILGQDHGYVNNTRYMRYVDGINKFVLVAEHATKETIAHGYDHTSVNPFTGDIYHLDYNSTVIERSLAGGAFSVLTNYPSHGYQQVAIGTCWWSGFFVGARAQGALILYNSGNAVNAATDGQIIAYDPLNQTWFFDKRGMAPFSAANGATYHSVIEYSSRKNVAVYGGGGAAPTKLWRLNFDGSFLPMPNTPSGKQVGVYNGNLAVDPVTGNFLLLSAGELWELNPSDAGQWTQQIGSRAPPVGVGIPGPATVAVNGVISCSIPEYGVVAYITQSARAGGTFYLYKHA